MTQDPLSHATSRPSVETSENVGRRCATRSLCAKPITSTLAAAFVVAMAQLAAGHAEAVERQPEQADPTVTTAPTAETGSALQTTHPKSPNEDPPLDEPELRIERIRDWWNRAREVLFSEIELSAEQTHALDAIIEAQMNIRAQLQQIDAKISAARKAKDSERSDAASEDFRVLYQQLKKTHEVYEEMRAVLAEEQRPAFDMNRARLTAEIQKSGQTRPKKRTKRIQ